MHLYALNKNGFPLNAAWAEVGRDYFCPECGEKVRVRGGIRVQRHFFHLRTTFNCRQDGKGIIHLMVQNHLLRLIPQAEMEFRFPEIKRIADVVWKERKIVFEVQCAPMSSEEAISRTKDYKSIGWQIIWILHDSRYNQIAVNPLEEALLNVPHYFTDIDETGKGSIYDQLSFWEDERRTVATPERKISLNLLNLPTEDEKVPSLLSLRQTHWPFIFEGDYFDFWLKQPSESIWLQILKFEKAKRKREQINLFKKLIHAFFVKPYRIFIQMLLESSCKKN